MNNKKNFISAFVLQIVTMISGLVLPRLILNTFNSEINGLISSITQFLSFISLVEGGLGAVVLAELYRPIEQKNDDKIHEIMLECQNYFSKIAIIFIVYTFILSVLYPLICNSSYSFEFISSLIIILSISTLIRYLFSVTYKLYLQANQKIYIVNYCSSLVLLLNLIAAFIAIKLFSSIHIVKISADILFLIQPFVYKKFVEKKYYVNLSIRKKNKNVLRERWSGFAQNLAHFINMNTDITIITIMIGLKEVSVYSVYMLAIVALRNIISLISNTYQSALGKYHASQNDKALKERYTYLQKINWIISLVLYGTCFLLINSFVKIYTSGINDANYYQPVFAGVIILATLFFSICEPQKFLVLAVGKFKKIKTIFIVEALLNIVLSIVLSTKYGLVGVALGTLISVTVRFFYFVFYLRKNIVFIGFKTYIPLLLFTMLFIVVNLYAYNNISFNIINIFDFVIYGIFVVTIESLIGGLYLFINQLFIKYRRGQL